MSALVLAVLLAANPWLEQAKEDFRGLDYERCVKRLEQASRNASKDRGELRDIELTNGLCRFHLGDEKAAAGHFKVALRLDDAAELPAFTSPSAVELFLQVKQSLRAPAEPFPDSDLPADAPKNSELLPKPSVDLTSGPPPWRKHAAPIALGVVAIAAAAGAIALGLHAQELAGQANAATFESDFRALGDAARANALGANLAWGVAALSAAGAGALVAAGEPEGPATP